MKKKYLVPEVEVTRVTIERSFLATQVISLSGSSGENINGSTDYDDDWS